MQRFRDTDYFVTEDGRVISSKFGKTKELKPAITSGYYFVNLSINKKHYSFYIHRVVAEVYHPNPNNLPQVEHLDNNKLNNHFSNLEWVTHQENMNRAKNDKLFNNVGKNIGEKHGMSKLTEKDVLWIRENYIPRDKEFGGIPLGKKFNISSAVISDIISNKIWKHI
jgi:hypothetical protein